MTDDELIKENNKFLLEEYRQVYEQYRHCDNISKSKESIFAVAAFGVLAYVIGKDLSFWTMFGAAVVSICLFLYNVLAIEKMSFYRDIAAEKLVDIEKINVEKFFSKDNIDFQKRRSYYENNVIKNQTKKWRRKKCIRIKAMLWKLFLLLLILWGVVLIVKKCETHHETQKHWPQHNQTRYHQNR